jgi:hypothetical protein
MGSNAWSWSKAGTEGVFGPPMWPVGHRFIGVWPELVNAFVLSFVSRAETCNSIRPSVPGTLGASIRGPPASHPEAQSTTHPHSQVYLGDVYQMQCLDLVDGGQIRRIWPADVAGQREGESGMNGGFQGRCGRRAWEISNHFQMQMHHSISWPL